MALRKLQSVGGSAVFSLPYYVAREEGYFAEEGLDIEIPLQTSYLDTASAHIELVEDHRTVDAFHGHFSAFEQGEAEIYRACEWGQIRRSHDSEREGRIIGRRASVASQAILVRPDSPYNIPQDLANVPVGVNFHAGSHYIAIQMLEGFLRRDELKVVGVTGGSRFVALRDGLVDAIAVMEPWISVGEKLGYKVICEAHYIGSEIAGPDLDAATFAAITRAVTKAVRKINADITPYLHYFVEEVPADIVELSTSDLHLNRLRFIEPAPYPQDQFDRTFDWMVGWGLIAPDAGFEEIVDNRIAVVAG
jgi:NitT/TauT family transport system substrate-binding protein